MVETLARTVATAASASFSEVTSRASLWTCGGGKRVVVVVGATAAEAAADKVSFSRSSRLVRAAMTNMSSAGFCKGDDRRTTNPARRSRGGHILFAVI